MDLFRDLTALIEEIVTAFSKEPWFFISVAAISLINILVITLAEFFVIRWLRRLETFRGLIYAVLANGFGFIAILISGSIGLIAFSVFFAGAMAGAGAYIIGSLVFILFLLFLTPLLIIFVRFLLFRFLKVTETKFRLVYALLSTLAFLVVFAALWTLTMTILSYFS